MKGYSAWNVNTYKVEREFTCPILTWAWFILPG
jgi:hypothetical protein